MFIKFYSVPELLCEVVDFNLTICWSLQSEKTLLVSRPNCPGAQIWQIYPPWYQTSMTTLQISFSDFQVYLVTLLIDPPICESISTSTLSLQCNIKRPIVQCNIKRPIVNIYKYIYIYISTSKDRLRRK